MPELPEVETIVRQLREKVTGQIIAKVKILRPSQWKQNKPNSVVRKLKNKKIIGINRRAKFIVIELDESCQLIIHLRMTGKLIWADDNPNINNYTRTILYFTSGGSLQFNDTRALGTLAYFTCEQLDTWQNKLGLEPLSDQWEIGKLKIMLSKSRLDMKSFLLDQTKIAGVGNIYASEILFRSGIHPERKAHTLSNSEINKLYKNVPAVLQLAVDKMGTSLGDGKQNFRSLYNIEGEFQNMIKVYDREREKCFKCKSLIIRIKQKGRSSYYCEECQK